MSKGIEENDKHVERKNELIVTDHLTDKERMFCVYYIKYWNATKAYKKAFPTASQSTCSSEGSKMKARPKVAREIARLRDEIIGDVLFDSSAVLRKWIDIAFADITDYVEFGHDEVLAEGPDGDVLRNTKGEEVVNYRNWVKLKKHTEVDGTLVTEVRQGKDGVVVKLADKTRALDVLTRFSNLLNERDMQRLQEEKLKLEIAAMNKGDSASKVEIVIVDEWEKENDNEE